MVELQIHIQKYKNYLFILFYSFVFIIYYFIIFIMCMYYYLDCMPLT